MQIDRLYKFGLLITGLAFSVIVLGAYTRLTDAGLGCPDWPGCYGQWILSQDFQSVQANNPGFNIQKAWTEMAHRYLAGILGLLIFILGFQIFRLKKNPFIKIQKISLRLSFAVMALVIFQALLGMWTVTLKLFPVIVMAHLLGGLTMLALLYCLTLTLKKPESFLSRTDAAQTSPKMTLAKIWSTLGLLVLIFQIFLGGWTSANYAALVCLDFPACFAGQYFPSDLNLSQAFNFFAARNSASITIHMAHRFGALLTALVLYGLCFYLYYRIALPNFKRIALSIALILSVQIFLGIANILALLPLPIALAHNAIAALLLLGLVHLNYTLWTQPSLYQPVSPLQPEFSVTLFQNSIVEFLTLCKPKVVLVMLVTSWVGMCFADPQYFSWKIVFYATFGIGLTGGAAAVINHVVDRKIDAKMLRTKLRPLASGRISPLAAVIFAVIIGSLGLSSLFIFVNPLTAILTLSTLGGYAILYTLLLKRRTPQNIVIGGAAGAMPPLLGWAAISNDIHPHALLLVLIIFVWTPPHFWALAIYRQQDYLQANIPMLPVTHGIPYTKFSILLYTLLLIISSLLPFVVGMSGRLYLLVALILGIAFFIQTLGLYRSESKSIALKTFSFSIVYLLLLFSALLLDKLLNVYIL